jgi:hypothetical protein
MPAHQVSDGGHAALEHQLSAATVQWKEAPADRGQGIIGCFDPRNRQEGKEFPMLATVRALPAHVVVLVACSAGYRGAGSYWVASYAGIASSCSSVWADIR